MTTGETTEWGEATLAVRTSLQFNRLVSDLGEELVVSKAATPNNLRLLLDSLSNEDSTHSWKNLDRTTKLEDLLRWENSRRPTEVFFFYLRQGEELHIVGTGSTAGHLNTRFTDPGFCVLGRSFILPKYRGRGIYRRMLQFRLERCMARLGKNLQAVHMGSDDARVAHVINQPSSDWPRFQHLGEEALSIAGKTKLVNAYILLLPTFSQRLAHALQGQGVPPALTAIHNLLTGTELGEVRNLGIKLRDALAGAKEREWLSMRDSSPIDQLMAFCGALPLAGFE